MRVRIDPTRCQGYGVCVEFASDHFSYDDWGFAQSHGREVSELDAPRVERAVKDCPIRAIRWLEG